MPFCIILCKIIFYIYIYITCLLKSWDLVWTYVVIQNLRAHLLHRDVIVWMLCWITWLSYCCLVCLCGIVVLLGCLDVIVVAICSCFVIHC